jgi:hypothetical protein
VMARSATWAFRPWLWHGLLSDTGVMRRPGDNDLGFVRHQLDDLDLSRALGALTDSDRIRYTELCEQERLLLGVSHP